MTQHDIVITEIALDPTKATQPTITSLKLRWSSIIGIDIPRYANTKFSHIYPDASIKCSMVIWPIGLRE